MTDKARELLELALEELIEQDLDLRSEFYTGGEWEGPKVIEEIRAYLAEPEVKPLSNTDIYPFCGVVKMPEGWNTFANQETNTNPSETINSQEVDRSGGKQDEEPVAWTCQDELNALGTDVTCYMYAEPLVGETNIPLYLHPAPCPEFVRLSEEEVNSLTYAPYEPYELICAVENMLERKNRG